LPSPEKCQPEIARASEPPRTEIEKAVADLWEEVLECRKSNRSDDFFGIGGDASLAGRVISNIEQTCHVRLQPQILFQSPTLADFARRLERVFLEQARAGESAAETGSTAAVETTEADLAARAARAPVEQALAGMWRNCCIESR